MKMKQLLYAISGYKNSGKTTLITKIIPLLKEAGLKVAVIKHDGHDFEGDVPGTDSYRAKEAGAYGTAVFSANRILIHKQMKGADEKLLKQAFPEADVILLEGFKDSEYPKYVCHYPELKPDESQDVAKIILETYKRMSSIDNI